MTAPKSKDVFLAVTKGPNPEAQSDELDLPGFHALQIPAVLRGRPEEDEMETLYRHIQSLDLRTE